MYVRGEDGLAFVWNYKTVLRGGGNSSPYRSIMVLLSDDGLSLYCARCCLCVAHTLYMKVSVVHCLRIRKYVRPAARCARRARAWGIIKIVA